MKWLKWMLTGLAATTTVVAVISAIKNDGVADGAADAEVES